MSNMRNRPSTSGVKSIRSHSSQIARPQTALNRGQSAQKTKVGYRPKNRWNNEEYQDNLIQIAIKKIQNEKAYDVLIKMGEANEICQSLGLDTTYRVFSSANGSIKCQMFQNNERKETYSLTAFERKYKELKKRWYEEQNLQKWEMLHDLALNKNKSILTSQKYNKEKQEKEKGTVNKNERQKNLKDVLKETMNLTKTLKNQLAILKKKGINNMVAKTKKEKSFGHVGPQKKKSESNIMPSK